MGREHACANNFAFKPDGDKQGFSLSIGRDLMGERRKTAGISFAAGWNVDRGADPPLRAEEIAPRGAARAIPRISSS